MKPKNIQVCDPLDVAYGKPDASGTCSYTTTFDASPNASVSVSCGTTFSLSYGVDEACTGSNAEPTCLEPDFDTGSLPECTYGRTGDGSGPTRTYKMCFDCENGQWRAEITKMELKNTIKYDWHDKSNIDGVYTCDAATDAKCHLDYWENGVGNPCTQAQGISYTCIEEHEEQHAVDWCESFQSAAGTALDEVADIGLPVQDYCDESEADSEIDALMSEIFYDMDSRIHNIMEMITEANAKDVTIECFQALLDGICGHLDPDSCDACE